MRADLLTVLKPEQVLNYLDSNNISKKIDIINGTKEYITLHHPVPVIQPIINNELNPYTDNSQMWVNGVKMISNGVKNVGVYLLDHPIIPLTIAGLLCLSGGYYYLFHYIL